MAGGFTSPSILFLNTWDAPERRFCRTIFSALPGRGYTRFVEPCAGAFAMPLVAHNAGWTAKQMEASDSSLFSAIVGTMLDRKRRFEELEIAVDGDPAMWEATDRIGIAAELLWLQLYLRMQAKPADVVYWRDIVRNLEVRKGTHVGQIRRKLESFDRRLGGLKYEPLDMWTHMERVADDPHTVISINPPTYCLAHGQRVLTADLRWVDVRTVQVGDVLVGIDETTSTSTRRHYRPSTVTYAADVETGTVSVHLSDGTVVYCTPEHPWLARTGDGAHRSWVRSDKLIGYEVFRGFDTWETDESRAGGWLAGMYDGEGHLSVRPGEHSSSALSITQKPGPVMDQVEELLRQRGFKVNSYLPLTINMPDRDPVSHAVISSTAEIARALGSLRPTRLLPKYHVERPARAIDVVRVVDVRPAGTRTIRSLSTSTHTYIGEGFWMHNTGGFERFFDTKGRLTWAEPDYEVFEPLHGIPRIVEMMEGRNALLVCQQQREPGDSAHKTPIFARHLSPGQYVYLNSNRPDEVFDITGGPMVSMQKAPEVEALGVSIIPGNHQVTETSTVRLVPVSSKVADYYRQLWMHRLAAAPGPMNIMVLVDGYAAGVFAYNLDSMTNPHGPIWARHVILRFAFGAPHESLRLTRLITMIALQRSTIDITLTPLNAMLLEVSEGLVTIEYTKHPEAKGLRGLMKLHDRTPHDDGFRLIYGASWQHKTLPEVMGEFVRKEAQWRKSRS